MFFIAVHMLFRMLFRQRIGRPVLLASVALFLLLAVPVNASILSAARSTGFARGGGDDNGIQMPPHGSSPLIRNSIFTTTTSSHNSTVTSPDAGTTVGESPHYTADANKRVPNWNGIWRDTGTLFGSQIVAAGVIYIMPESISGWSGEQKKNSFKKYAQNFASPVIDKDKVYVNYLLHPYWGATYYTRARDRGLDKGASFAYSAMISTMFEFGVECFYEKPSFQDLIVTPVAGSLIGALIFEPWRDSIKRKGALRWHDHAVLVATDPVGVLSLGFEKIFGIKPTIMIENSVPKLQKSAGSVIQSTSNRIGVVLQFPLN